MADAKGSGAEKGAPKKKIKRNVPDWPLLRIQAGFGNTIVTFTDLNGNTVCWASAPA